MNLLAPAVSFLFAVALPSQIVVPNPIPWPLGHPVPSTLANDTTQPLPFQFCTPTVTDVNGQLIAWGICAQVELLLPPGETVTTYWHQTDASGQQVPPGLYHVNGVPFVIGATELGIQPLGQPLRGAIRSIELCATNGAGLVYAVGASFTATAGIGLGCGVHLPIDHDWLLGESLTNSAVFPDFVGMLDAAGRTSAPAIVLPALPILQGITFQLAFVTVSPAAPCGFERASHAVAVTIQ